MEIKEGTRRINLFGGPGVGKSTYAAKLFVELKSKHKNCELISEYVKKWAFIGRKPQPFDQPYIFAKQLQSEYSCLSKNKDLIVITDSPILLSTIYSQLYHYELHLHESLINLALKFENFFPSQNFFIKRNENWEYQQNGRYEDLQAAQKVDNFILDFLNFGGVKYTTIDIGVETNI